MATGAFSVKSRGRVDSGFSDSYNYITSVDFDASRGETKIDGTLKTDSEHKVYGASNHVTPNNATIKVWQRIS